MTAAGRQLTRPERFWRKEPTATTGTIAASEVASALSCERPRPSVSAGTKTMPPPTPKRPASTPAGEAEREGQCDMAHQASLAATRIMKHANASCSCGPRTRFASSVPSTTPTTAGRPISSASRHTTRSSQA